MFSKIKNVVSYIMTPPNHNFDNFWEVSMQSELTFISNGLNSLKHYNFPTIPTSLSCNIRTPTNKLGSSYHGYNLGIYPWSDEMVDYSSFS